MTATPARPWKKSPVKTPAIHISFFQNFAASSISVKELSLSDLAKLILNTTAPSKDKLPWLKLAKFGDKRSPKNSLRYDANVLCITGIETDYDGGVLSLDAAAGIIKTANLQALLYTSPSHTEDKPRWRILLPTSKDLAPSTRAKLVARINGLFDGVLASESFVLSQAYYFGSINSNPAHQAICTQGNYIDLRDDLDAAAITNVNPYEAHTPAEELQAEDPALIAIAMSVLPNEDVPQPEYNRIGMACWAASNGSQAGFEAFDAWARKSKKYHGGTAKRWKHYFRSPPDRIGAGTLFFMADEINPHWRDSNKPELTQLGEQLASQLLLPKVIELPEPSLPDLLLPKELPPHLLNVPGLVGEIAQWINETAIYPQPALSLGAALTVVGTAAGRHIAGPTRSGTHLYIIGIARTGTGKNHPLSQIATLMSAANMHAHIGPSQFISMPAVINFLKREPLSVCAMDEFGAFLKRVNNKRASGFEGAVSSVLRQAWGSSFTKMTTPEWAQTPSQQIESPAMSIFGVSTVKEFYDSLEGADIVNGILNRFLIIETSERPEQRAPLSNPNEVPETISQQLLAIYARLGGAMNKQSTTKPQYVKLEISPTAEKIRMAFVNKLHKRGDADEEVGALLARTAEIAIRLATIVAVGQGVDCIEADVMTWARDFAEWSSDKLAESAGLYIADSENQAMANEVRRVIKRKSNGSKRVKHSVIVQALKYKFKSRDLKDVIDQMVVGGDLKVEKSIPEGGGPPTYWYSLTA
jgi:hypothetical protein